MNLTWWWVWWLTVLWQGLLGRAAVVGFSDCLSSKPNGPYFTPTKVEAWYINRITSTNNTMKFRVHGKMTGGLLVDLNDKTNKYTTLHTEASLLQYDLFNFHDRLCNKVDGDKCPFNESSFVISYDLDDSYQAVSINTKFTIINTQSSPDIMGCVQIETTPVLAHYIWYIVIFSIIAIFITFCLIYAACCVGNPWTGTKDVYVSTSNFKQESNSIRLITPGMFDFVRYLQFALLTGALHLHYPGFMRPLLAAVGWSSLMFGLNFASNNGPDLHDDLYALQGRFGMSKMARAIQLNDDQDIWPGFIIWLAIVTAVVLNACFLGYVVSWIYRQATNDKRDLRSKFWHFLGGICIRLFYGIFGVPIVALTLFEIIIIGREDTSIVADVFAVITLVVWVAVGAWLVKKVWAIPREQKFDDLKNMLLYGPLYNTYTETRANFFVFDLGLTLLRGVGVGALQDSGLAQVVLLVITELCYFFALVVMRPYEKATSMNLIHGIWAVIRAVVIFLMIPFVGSLGVNYIVRGWIGYVILLVHAIVIILCAIHCLQVVVEVALRKVGAGRTTYASDTTPAFGMKALSKRKGNLEDNAGMEYKDGTNTPDELLINQAAVGRTNTTSGLSKGTTTIASSSHKRSESATVHDGRHRDGVFDDVFLASPASEASPASANPTSGAAAGFFRQPRNRRKSSYDWAYGPPGQESSRSPDKEKANNNNGKSGTTTDTDDEFTFVNAEDGSSAKRRASNVNYAVREADVFFNQRTQTASWGESENEFDGYDDYEDYEEFRNRNSINPLVSPGSDGETSAQQLSSSATTSGGWGIFGKLKDTLKSRNATSGGHRRVSQNSNDDEGETGFQVMRRPPIRPYNAIHEQPSVEESPTVGEDSEPPNTSYDNARNNLTTSTTNEQTNTKRTSDDDADNEGEIVFPQSPSSNKTDSGLRILTSADALSNRNNRTNTQTGGPKDTQFYTPPQKHDM